MLYCTFVKQQLQINKLKLKLKLKLTFTRTAFRALPDLLDLLERKDLLEDQGQWDLLELVESVEKLDQRYCRFFCHLITVWYKCKYVTTINKICEITGSSRRAWTPRSPWSPRAPYGCSGWIIWWQHRLRLWPSSSSWVQWRWGSSKQQLLHHRACGPWHPGHPEGPQQPN